MEAEPTSHPAGFVTALERVLAELDQSLAAVEHFPYLIPAVPVIRKHVVGLWAALHNVSVSELAISLQEIVLLLTRLIRALHMCANLEIVADTVNNASKPLEALLDEWPDLEPAPHRVEPTQEEVVLEACTIAVRRPAPRRLEDIADAVNRFPGGCISEMLRNWFDVADHASAELRKALTHIRLALAQTDPGRFHDEHAAADWAMHTFLEREATAIRTLRSIALADRDHKSVAARTVAPVTGLVASSLVAELTRTRSVYLAVLPGVHVEMALLGVSPPRGVTLELIDEVLDALTEVSKPRDL
jgi:hypothetical protein